MTPGAVLFVCRISGQENDLEYPPLTLWAFSVEFYYKFAIQENLRIFPNRLFTGRGRKGKQHLLSVPLKKDDLSAVPRFRRKRHCKYRFPLRPLL